MKNSLFTNLILGLIVFALTSSIPTYAEQSASNVIVPSLPFELKIDQKNGSINVSDTHITIQADKGTDLFTSPTGNKNKANTPSALFAPEGDFIFSAKVSAKFADTPYDGGALVVFANDKIWAKLLFERFKSGKLGVATTVSNLTGDDAYHSTIESEEVHLKVVRYDTSYIFYTSKDGVDWNFTRHFDLDTDEKPSIGFIAQSPLADSFTATFSNISFRAQRFKDFWQGE